MGFGEKSIAMIMTCVFTMSYSVPINGQSGERFKPQRGLCQGNSISPNLFILCVEGFSAIINEAENSKRIKEVQVATRAPLINNLLFVDDSLLFCQTNINE